MGIPQQVATVMYEDNGACTAMTNVQKPITWTRHVDIRYFALSERVEHDLMILERIHTSVNVADHMAKILDRTLFYRHVDYITGHIPPKYSPMSKDILEPTLPPYDDTANIDDLAISPQAAAAAKCQVTHYPWLQIVAPYPRLNCLSLMTLWAL
ncbi:hypothetical protein ACHAW6_010248 [Cyclotella cf. meneghiniana]